MFEVYINIGSNLGDRINNISNAIELIKKKFDTRISVSDPVTSQAWGYQSANNYINVGIVIYLNDSVPPIGLLDMLLDIEKTIDGSPHRNEDGSYRDRIIDIDIIAIDNQKISSPRLTIPHPRMSLRDFVLIPMMQLMPKWVHPDTGLTPEKMLANLHTPSFNNS